MYRLIIILFIFSFSCSLNHQIVTDIEKTPQNAFYFVKQNRRLISSDFQQLLDNYFNKFFFSPWKKTKSSYDRRTAFWGFYVYPNRKVYGENKRRLSKNWFSRLRKNADVKNFPSLSLWGITVSNTDLKVFPTQKPVFYSFDKAGEGFPFDYNQNSAVYIGTPLFISHISKDKQWYYVETPFAFGWIKANDVAILDEEIKQLYQTGKYIAFIKENVPLIDENGNFLSKGLIGVVLPLVKEEEDSYEVFVPVKDTDGYAVLKTVRISKDVSVIKPMPFTEKNIAKIINETLNKPYGWGGLYLNRDCSANIRDIFVPFGIWLPRNSTSQAKSGIFASLESMSEKQKEEFIAKSGIPFLTLVWMPGHIMLYIGNKDGKPYIFHNFWGIKTKIFNKEGRIIVGMSAITSLSPEKGVMFVDKQKGIFLKRIKGITYIVPPKYLLK